MKKTGTILVVLFCVIFVFSLMFFMIYSANSWSNYRISDDANREILYIKNNVAIERTFFPENPLEPKGNIYYLCKAHYMGVPDYKFQTGDVTDEIIIKNVLSINASEDDSIVMGTFLPKRMQPNKAYFVFMDNNINLFYKKDEFKAFLHDRGVPSINFLSPRAFIDKNK